MRCQCCDFDGDNDLFLKYFVSVTVKPKNSTSPKDEERKKYVTDIVLVMCPNCNNITRKKD